MAYSLATSYAGDSLVSGFNWTNGRDLSNGFVQYQSQEDALDRGLYSVDPFAQTVRLEVDYDNVYALDEGRPSIRLESKETFQYGLFIADFLHMPPSQCGTWPAFWAYGDNWPQGGEIDIVEGANLAYTNVISGHTAKGCQLDPADAGLFSGDRRNLDCFAGEDNIGCGFNPPASDTSSYGDGFNAANGGVYAMEWDSEYIKVWHFPRGAIPADIGAKMPDPKKWGLPQALFGGSKCDVDDYFSNMNIVININFCGDYGEGTWRSFETCRALAPTCREYVANNPEDFENAYWDVSYIDVYTRSASIPPILPPSKEQSSTELTGAPMPSNPNEPNPSDENNSKPANTPNMSRPTNQTASSEPTTTTTLTRTAVSTILVTIPGQGTNSPTVVPLPVSGTGGSVNPSRIGDYAYIGCFGSQTGFQTFDQTAQGDDMTLERCVAACDGKTYVGVFEGTCYCATRLDADTRANANQSDCNIPCPGNDEEFCGGLVAQSTGNSDRWAHVRRDAPSSVLLTVYADLSDTERPDIPPAMGPAGPTSSGGQLDPTSVAGLTALDGSGPADQTGSGGQLNPTGIASQAGSNGSAPAGQIGPGGQLNPTGIAGQAGSNGSAPAGQTGPGGQLNPTGIAGQAGSNGSALAGQTGPGGQAGSAITRGVADFGRPGVTTTVTYFTVLPSNPGVLVPQQSVVTRWYEQCGCKNPRLLELPMETKTVLCNACGARGESTVTLTIPVTIAVTIAVPTIGNQPIQPGAPASYTSQLGAQGAQDATRSVSGGSELTTRVAQQAAAVFTTQLVSEDIEVFTRMVSDDEITTRLVQTRVLKQTVFVTVSKPTGNMQASAQPDDTVSSVPPLIPSEATNSAEAVLPAQPTTPAVLVTPIPTPGAPDQPVIVAGAELSGMNGFKTSFVTLVAVAVIFAALL
ncbi:hypothetical protein FZEAL_8036 [Fusarium zealandicum]|uniref:Endo-1,3(4)-beta-glucanase n=1 Tax=Fusarium zealandicum TaxID=1053134 RepID=A0A8H4XI88_9HYPO|nr:hypothetical protein FZEAL_8036 [Fusarium zealandicum]